MTRWHLKGKPYEVQSRALEKSKGRAKFAYFMEMGLGKTSTTLNDYIDHMIDDIVDLMVVVCPNSLMGVWKDEMTKWGVADIMQPAMWPKETVKKETRVYIMNIESMIGRGGQYLDKLIAGRKVFLVLDESILVKNPTAKRTRRMIDYSETTAMVRLLSGAPMVNGVMDLYAQLYMSGAKIPPNPFAFRNRYAVMGGYMGKKVVGIRNQEKLTEVMEACSFTAKKKDWTDLPDKLYTQREYIMSKPQEKAYKEMLNHFITMVNGEEITADMVLIQANKLQQISSGFIFDEEGEVQELVSVDKNPKIKLVKEMVEESSTKIIIFCLFKKSVANLREAFPDAPFIKGQQDREEQAEMKAKFNEGDAKLMICQVTAGKYGHTLLGTEEMPCHSSVYYENSYDLDARLQSEDRNHRHGQKYPVTYTDLVGSPIDKACIRALVKKQTLAETIAAAVKELKNG